MATSPAPVLCINGQARSVERFERVENRETGESRQAARVQVLTDRGGFVEVYVAPDHLDVLPVDADLPAAVSWDVEVSAWNRAAFGQDDVPNDQKRRYATLSVRFVPPAPAHSRRPQLAATSA